VTYDFDGLVGFKHPFQLAPILDLAKAMPAARVEITGHRGAALLSDGTVMPEQADLARRRAEQVAELLRGAGLTAPAYDVRWVDAAPAPDGVNDYRQRRVEITLRP
jgi:outer membrane protein OmpA-like peptidoglycan-associated protein